MWRTTSFLNNQVFRNKEITRLEMLCKVMLTKITVANHGCYVLGGIFPVLLAAQLISVMILKHPSHKGNLVFINRKKST